MMTPEQILDLEAWIAMAMGVTLGWGVAFDGRSVYVKAPRYLSDANASRELRLALNREGWLCTLVHFPGTKTFEFHCDPLADAGGGECAIVEDIDEFHAVARVFCEVKGIAWPEEVS